MDTSSDKPKKLKREYDEISLSPSSTVNHFPTFRILIWGLGTCRFYKLNFRFPFAYAICRTWWGVPKHRNQITGAVRLVADKGYQHVPIIRIFYEYKNEVFSPEIWENRPYDRDLQEARLKADFSYPMLQQSLSDWKDTSTMDAALRA